MLEHPGLNPMDLPHPSPLFPGLTFEWDWSLQLRCAVSKSPVSTYYLRHCFVDSHEDKDGTVSNVDCEHAILMTMLVVFQL